MLISMLNLAAADDESHRSCRILVDWDEEIAVSEGGEYDSSILHRYRTVFEPPFSNGSSPIVSEVAVNHIRNGANILTTMDVSSISAGGEVDVTLTTTPEFGDAISISVTTTDSSCSRALEITNWNQPIMDHEVTRETDWSMSGVDGSQGISFDGRGWQKRTGEVLESNELGNGSLFLDFLNGTEGAIISLDLDSIWLNETYFSTDLIQQDFEMLGSGWISLGVNPDPDSNAQIQADIDDARVLRSFSDGKITERISLGGTGWISLNEGSNDSEQGAFGQIEMFHYEIWDEDGFRRLHDVQLEANASVRLSAAGDGFSFDLDELIFREKWEEGVRTDHFTRLYGSGDFDFVASDEYPYIEVNGTIPIFHLQSEGGETITDTVIVDGTYNGDASGSFGQVREIVESGVFSNSSGTLFEANKIRNEYWLNVSTTPLGPIEQEIEAEHNLTYEYVVPQEDWANRTIRLTYVEDNSTEEELPENSPVILQADAPDAQSIFSNHISRETGLCPSVFDIGDQLKLIGNKNLKLHIHVSEIEEGIVDGHAVEIAIWNGTYADLSLASGSTINEGVLSGLLDKVTRQVSMGIGEIGNQQEISFIENQFVDRVLFPSVISSSENTPLALADVPNAFAFREGILTTEGGLAHLEVDIFDFDTDAISISVDLSEIGLGVIPLSDSGLNGDRVIHDSVWTAEITHEGLEFGELEIPVLMQDYWGSVEDKATITITNSPPRLMSAAFNPISTFRGSEVEISVNVVDGHGVSSVAVDLTGSGGPLSDLEFREVVTGQWVDAFSAQTYSAELWGGSFVIPDSMAPGNQNIPLYLVDNQGSSISTIEIGGPPTTKSSRQADKLSILNQPPIISNLTFLAGQLETPSVILPESGDPIEHSLEVKVNDPDGVVSVQAKIGRLAPIGKSESWMLLLDDGNNSDRVAGDGIYSLSFSTRSTLAEGQMEIMIRATDTYQSMTAPGEQIHQIQLTREGQANTGQSWISKNSTEILIGSIMLSLALGIGAFAHILRNSELD
tara:strand:+ start:6970 stop:10023 length:3054 start_codon:yes stop_codon:yes gene_type:complete